MWLFKKQQALNDVDLSQCNPIIVNQTQQSVVLFLDRGVLYNKQVLAPGEAVGMTRQQTAGKIMPYKIHAVVGDEKSLPTRRDSVKNLISTAVFPTAFIVGTLAAASSAGTLAGPSRALSRVAGGLVVRGMVIDSAALAAGSLAADRAQWIAEKLIREKPENFAAKSGHCLPGKQFVVIRGGIDEPLTINFLKEKEFRNTIPIEGQVKSPTDTLQDKIEYYTPSIFKTSKIEAETNPPLEAEVLIETATEQQLAIAEGTGTVIMPSAPTEEEEDEQLRLAIEESLKVEEQSKAKQKKEDLGSTSNKVVLY